MNIAGDGQDTAVTNFVAVGGDQHIVDELGHTAHVGADQRDGRSHRLERHNRLTLIVAGHEQQVEAVEHRTHVHGAVEGDVLAHVELFDGAQAQFVVLGQVVLGAEHVQMEVHQTLIAQHREGANQVSQALNGHHAGDEHEAPHVAAALSEDAGTRRLAGVVGFRHGLDEHTVGQNDCAVLLALVHLVDGRTNTACLFQRLGVQVGCHVGARVAEATHFHEPDGPGTLIEGDRAQAGVLTLLVEEGVVGGDGLRHVAFELGVHGVANVEVVLGQ